MPPAFARNSFLGFISGAAVALSGFISSAIAARLVGADGMGVIAYAVWCVMVAATVADLGMALVLQRFIPNLRAEGKHDEAEGLTGATARLSVMSAIVGSLVLFAWLYWPGSSAMQAHSQTSHLVLIVLVVASFIALNLGAFCMAYLKGEQQFGELARLTTLSAFIRLLVTGLGTWLFGVPGAIAAYVAAYVVQATRIRSLLRKRPHVDRELRRQIMRFALPAWSAGVIGGLVWGRTEIVFLEHYAGIGAVGLFAAASMLTEMAMQLPGLLLSAMLPHFSAQFGLGAQDQIHRLYRTVTGAVALIVVPLCIGTAAIAPVLVPLLFGADFADAALVATVLLISAAVTGVGTTTVNLIYSTGKSGFLLISNALGLAGTIAFGFLVIPHFGVMGAAWSRSAVQVFVVAIETWYVTKKLGFVPPYRALGTITLAAAIQGAVAYVIVTELGGIASLVLAIPVSVVLFVAALRAFAVLPMVDPSLVDTLLAHVPRRVARLLSWILKLASPAPKGDSAPD